MKRFLRDGFFYFYRLMFPTFCHFHTWTCTVCQYQHKVRGGGMQGKARQACLTSEGSSATRVCSCKNVDKSWCESTSVDSFIRILCTNFNFELNKMSF